MSNELNPADLAAALAHRACCGIEPLQAQLADRVRMLSFVQDQLTERNRENEQLKERERQLREALVSLEREISTRFGRDEDMSADLRRVIEPARAALALP